MPTVNELIHSSFRLIGAIAAGETLETDELNDAFVSLNQMIASWNQEGLSLVGRQRLLVPVTAANSYLLSTRPIKIDAASVSISGIDCGLEIVDAQAWEMTPEKQQTAVIIRRLFCDYLYPQSTVYIWPTPRMAGTLELWIYAPLPAFATPATVIDLAPGYEQALRYNFAVALLPEYPRSQADPTLPAQAQNFKASLAQLNTLNHARSQQPAVAAS